MPRRISAERGNDDQLMYGYFWCHGTGHQRQWQSALVHCRPRTPQEPKIDDEGKWTATHGQMCGRCKEMCFPYRVEYIQCSICGSTEDCECCRRCRRKKDNCTCCEKCHHRRQECTCCKVCRNKRGKCTCCVYCKRLLERCVCEKDEDGNLIAPPDLPAPSDDLQEKPDEAEDRKPDSKRPHLRHLCGRCQSGKPC